MENKRVSIVMNHLSNSVSYSKPWNIRVRQIALVVKDLDSGIKKVGETLGLTPTFRDPEIVHLGLKNCVFVVGNQFLELVCPLSEDNTAYKQLQRRQGDGGYMMMLQTRDLERDKDRLIKTGFKTVFDVERDEVREIHLHPKDTTKCIVSFTQTFPKDDEWVWGGPDWKESSKASTRVFKSIVGVIIQCDNLSEATKQYGNLLMMTPNHTTDREVVFEYPYENRLKFQRICLIIATDGRGPGLNGLELEATDPSRIGDQLSVLGLNITFL